MFFAIVITIWALIHFYIGRRILAPLKLRGWCQMAARTALVVMFAQLPVNFFLNRMADASGWGGMLYLPVFLLAGFTLIVFPLLALRDLGLFSFKLLSRFSGSNPKSNPGPNPSRRMFLANSFNAGIFGLSGMMTTIGYKNAMSIPEMVYVTVPVSDLNDELDGYKIALISDTHVGHTIHAGYIKGIVDSVNKLNPDMVCITGDLADGYVPAMKQHIKPLGDLRAQNGVYFVTGNHEYYWDCIGWINEVRKLGIDVLLNEHRVALKGASKILIAGVTDFRAGGYIAGHDSDPVKAVRGAPDCDYKIMLAHQPRSAPAVSKTGVDLQLSGHTHGGQFFPWNFVVPLFHPAPTGLSRYNGMRVYVSRGAGHWGPPVRFGVPPEVTLITLKRDGSSKPI